MPLETGFPPVAIDPLLQSWIVLTADLLCIFGASFLAVKMGKHGATSDSGIKTPTWAFCLGILMIILGGLYTFLIQILPALEQTSLLPFWLRITMIKEPVFVIAYGFYFISLNVERTKTIVKIGKVVAPILLWLALTAIFGVIFEDPLPIAVILEGVIIVLVSLVIYALCYFGKGTGVRSRDSAIPQNPRIDNDT